MRGVRVARRLGRPGTAGRSLLLGLVLLLVGCSGGGDSGSLTPVNAPAALEDQATQNLVDLYCTAVLQEDSDRLQALLEGRAAPLRGARFVISWLGPSGSSPSPISSSVRWPSRGRRRQWW